MHKIPLTLQGNNILIIGNRSYRNLGDELILIGTIKLLQSQHKNIYIQAYDPKWLEGFLRQFVDTSKITFLTEIPKGIRSWISFLRNEIIVHKGKNLLHYAKIDATIVGGGEILTEENPNSYRYWLVSLLPVLIRKIFKKTNIYLMGGIQIPHKKLNKKLFNFLLSKTERIFARDHHSVQELTDYGYNHAEFFMDTAYYAWDWEHVSHSQTVPSQKKYIIININKNGEKFIDEILADVEAYHTQGYDIYYCPVSKGKNPEYSDIKYYKTVCTHLKTEIKLLDWETDFESFVRVIKGADIVISTRLHLFLIASFMGTKTKVYPYQRKILKMQEVLKKL